MDHKKHRDETISGVKWNMLNQVISQGVTFTVGIVLMRRLSPEVFGLVGMVTVFSEFLNIFTSFNLGNSLIQKKGIGREDKSTVFWVNLLVGIILTVVMYLGAGQLANYYDEPELKPLAQVLSLMFAFNTLGLTHSALLSKQMQFRKIFFSNTIPVVLAGATAIVMAYLDYGVWALVIQRLLYAILFSVMVIFQLRFIPAFVISKSKLKGHLKFGLPLFASKTFDYWTKNSDTFIIGTYLGAGPLGIYNRSLSILTFPVRRVTSILAGVLFPSFSLIQDDVNRLSKIYIKASRYLLVAILTLMMLMFSLAGPFVLTVLGEEWIEMVPILRIFSAIGIIQGLGHITGSIYMSQNKNGLSFRIGVVAGVCIIGSVFLSVNWGVLAVAYAILINRIVFFMVSTYFVTKIIRQPLMDYVKALAPLIVMAIVISGVGYYMVSISPLHMLLNFILGILMIVSIWFVALWVFQNSLVKELFALTKELLNKRK